MKKLSIFLALMPLTCMAQFGANVFSDNQKLISQAVENGFVVVEQAYQLEDPATGQRFGRYNDSIFGKGRALGVRVADYVTVDKSVVAPWLDDANFIRYQETHTPVVTSASLIELSNESVELELLTDSLSGLTASTIAVPNVDERLSGFTTQIFNEPTDGWLVWVTSEKPLNEWDGEATSYSIYRRKIDFNATDTEYSVLAPQNPNSVWGGAFLVPQQTQIGQITFSLGGLLVKNAEGQWMLEKFTASQPVEPQGEELSPVKSKAKKQKKHKK